jgi:hypothetical protein
MDSGNYFDIFYQNVRDLRAKSIEIFNNVCSLNFKIVCLTEMWVNESFSSQFFFTEMYTVRIYHSDRDCHTTVYGGGALTAISEAVLALNVDPTLIVFNNV